uniref:WD_REPEATS_REGION domain-containing protein n=1 Tax=Heterorhabditis bacteriophora TaxID=37862 RepID=A0A1I7X5Z3_HETBA
MGGSTSRGQPPVIADCRAPVYCVKKIGGRHMLLGGGGGAAKTGIVNQIEVNNFYFDLNYGKKIVNIKKNRIYVTINVVCLYYLFNSVIDSFAHLRKKKIPNCPTAMRAKLIDKIDTGTHSTMNMDVVCCSHPEHGKYLIAAGHDQVKYSEYCHKCVRFDRSTLGQRLVTGGADGHVRVWDVRDIIENRNPEVLRHPLTDISAHCGDVDDIDISYDGRIIISVGYDGRVILWDIITGRRIYEVPDLPELSRYKVNIYELCKIPTNLVRSVRFANLGAGENNHVFVAAYNEIQRSSRSSCFLTLWTYNRERQSLRPIVVKQARKGETISALCLSSCGSFTGIGTMGGSVAIFDTHEMKLLRFIKETHGIFVTGVEFLDNTAKDIRLPPLADGSVRNIPGAAACARTCLISLSADQTVQFL